MTAHSTRKSKSSLSTRGAELFGFIATFFPVIAAILLFSLDSFWDDWLSRNSAPILAGVLLVLLSEFYRSEKSRQKYGTLLEEATEKISPIVTSHEQLDAAVKSAFEIRPNPKRLRIFSISTINIQPYLMNAADTKIAEVKLLLANAETYIQQPHSDFLEESKLTILWNWVTCVKSGKVERLTLRQFNFYPTEWFVVLDEEVVIFGHYYYDEENIARAKSTETKFVVRNIPGSGDNLVRSYIKKFDELFNECETNFGVNWGVITSGDTNLTAGHWPSSI